MPKTTFKLNALFLFSLLLALTMAFDISNDSPCTELSQIELLAKGDRSKYYCLVLSANQTDGELIITGQNKTNTTFPSILFTYSYHKELSHPTVYCLFDGVLQFRRKVESINEEFFSFIEDTLNITLVNREYPSKLRQSLTSTSFAQVGTRAMSPRKENGDDHLKKVIIAIIIVFALSIFIVFIIKYSIDWALSSRLELNFQREVKKKDAIEALIENSTSNRRQTEPDREFEQD